MILLYESTGRRAIAVSSYSDPGNDTLHKAVNFEWKVPADER